MIQLPLWPETKRGAHLMRCLRSALFRRHPGQGPGGAIWNGRLLAAQGRVLTIRFTGLAAEPIRA